MLEECSGLDDPNSSSAFGEENSPQIWEGCRGAGPEKKVRKSFCGGLEFVHGAFCELNGPLGGEFGVTSPGTESRGDPSPLLMATCLGLLAMTITKGTESEDQVEGNSGTPPTVGVSEGSQGGSSTPPAGWDMMAGEAELRTVVLEDAESPVDAGLVDVAAKPQGMEGDSGVLGGPVGAVDFPEWPGSDEPARRESGREDQAESEDEVRRGCNLIDREVAIGAAAVTPRGMGDAFHPPAEHRGAGPARGTGDAFHPPDLTRLADPEWGTGDAFHPPTGDDETHVPRGTGDAFHPPAGLGPRNDRMEDKEDVRPLESGGEVEEERVNGDLDIQHSPKEPPSGEQNNEGGTERTV